MPAKEIPTQINQWDVSGSMREASDIVCCSCSAGPSHHQSEIAWLFNWWTLKTVISIMTRADAVWKVFKPVPTCTLIVFFLLILCYVTQAVHWFIAPLPAGALNTIFLFCSIYHHVVRRHICTRVPLYRAGNIWACSQGNNVSVRALRRSSNVALLWKHSSRNKRSSNSHLTTCVWLDHRL